MEYPLGKMGPSTQTEAFHTLPAVIESAGAMTPPTVSPPEYLHENTYMLNQNVII